MLGMTDLSQIPVSQFDGIEILYGAAGISKTSGAFGGVIDLVTYPTWNDRVNLTIAQSIASFNTFTTTGNVAAGGNKIQSITKFNYKSSINDFVYYNYADSVKITEHQTNSSYDLGGITEELFFKLNRKNFLTTKLWYSKDHKNIPPITTNKNPNHIENLSDEALRSLVEWKYLERNYSLTVRSAVVDQFMHYINDSLNSKHQTYSLVNRVRFNYSGIRNLTVKPGIDINYDWVFTDSYDADKSRSTNGLFCEINYNFLRKTDLSLVLRQDIIDGKFLPFVPAFGIDYRPFDKISLSFSGNISKNYRYPSLNDLYWSTFGNPDLKPETDYAGELGMTYKFTNRKGNFSFETEVSGYYSRMIDLIVWMPGSDGRFKPVNQREVAARGAEIGLNLSWSLFGVTMTFDNNYNYCKSTYEKAVLENDNSLGNQVIYVPINLANSTLSILWKGFSLSGNFTFVGKRFLWPDNIEYMPSYELFNLYLGKSFSIKNNVLSLQLQINNLLNLDYQSIAYRPMPGRNFELTLRYNFRRPIQK